MDNRVDQTNPPLLLPEDTTGQVYRPLSIRWKGHKVWGVRKVYGPGKHGQTDRTIKELWNRLNQPNLSHDERSFHKQSLSIVQQKAIKRAQNTFWGKIFKDKAKKNVEKKFAKLFERLKQLKQVEQQNEPTSAPTLSEPSLSSEDFFLEQPPGFPLMGTSYQRTDESNLFGKKWTEQKVRKLFDNPRINQDLVVHDLLMISSLGLGLSEEHKMRIQTLLCELYVSLQQQRKDSQGQCLEDAFTKNIIENRTLLTEFIELLKQLERSVQKGEPHGQITQEALPFLQEIITSLGKRSES